MENQWGMNRATLDTVKEYNSILKQIIHGIPFAVLSIVFIWILIDPFSLMLSLGFSQFLSLLGLLTFLFMFILGFLNSEISSKLWDIQPNRSIGGMIGQGFLFLLLIWIFNPIFLIVILFFPLTLYFSIASSTVSFVILSLLGGYLGKNIAAEFVPREAGASELASVHDRSVSCARCNAKFIVTPQDANEIGEVQCPQCGTFISVYNRGPIF